MASEKQYYNYFIQKDHINDCLRSKTPLPSFIKNKYKKYKTTRELKKKSKKVN